MKIRHKLAMLSSLFVPFGCAREETFPALGMKLAAPVDVSTSASGETFYILNSDSDRGYAHGSILLLTEEGEKLSAVPVPRLGRFMARTGSALIVAYDRQDESIGPSVVIYDVSAEHSLVPRASLPIDCAPANVATRESYDNFTVACFGGAFFVGTLDRGDLAQSTLKRVRQFSYTSRAMYLDAKRDLAFSFVSDIGRADLADADFTDKFTYDPLTGVATEVANEIPDDMEDSIRERRNSGQRRFLQFVVYNMGEERRAGFPERLATEETVLREFRWMYFTLTSPEGIPDTEIGSSRPESKAYRTNFWEAKPDPQDVDAFYISHRGSRGSPFANNVVRVRIVGDVAAVGKPIPFTADVMDFERVYGFLGEVQAQGRHYPGDFEVAIVAGKPLLLVNHFRDLAFFRGQEILFSIAAKVLGENFWFSELATTDAESSYYQIAVNERGKAMTLSFYGNAAIPLDVDPGISLSISPRGRIQ